MRSVDLGDARVSYAVFPPSFSIPSHYHDRACVSVILEGRFEQRFPGRVCDCPPGGVIAKAPGERHVDRWHGARTEHVIIEPHPDRHDAFGPCGEVLEGVTHRVDPRALSLARRVRRELERPDPASDLALRSLVLESLVALYRAPGEASAGGRPPAWLLRVRDHLHDRYAESVGLDDLAVVAGVHPTHVSRCFSRHFGRGVAAYLRELRLAAAKRDLADTDDGIAAVAFRHGFSDQSHLGRVLKRETGLTPARFRAEHGR